ncbi:hypothetical protein HAX54_037653, partial [Datura stramonium]|nr:hypothetical protein [Datura stramonium]
KTHEILGKKHGKKETRIDAPQEDTDKMSVDRSSPLVRQCRSALELTNHQPKPFGEPRMITIKIPVNHK